MKPLIRWMTRPLWRRVCGLIDQRAVRLEQAFALRLDAVAHQADRALTQAMAEAAALRKAYARPVAALAERADAAAAEATTLRTDLSRLDMAIAAVAAAGAQREAETREALAKADDRLQSLARHLADQAADQSSAHAEDLAAAMADLHDTWRQHDAATRADVTALLHRLEQIRRELHHDLRACSTIIATDGGVEQALSLCFERQLCRRAEALICRRCLSFERQPVDG